MSILNGQICFRIHNTIKHENDASDMSWKEIKLHICISYNLLSFFLLSQTIIL